MEYAFTQALVKKYLGKDYGTGFSACRKFAIAFYEEIFNIAIPSDYMEMLHVLKVVKKPKFGDVVLIKNHPIVVNHLGIYLGDNEFLQTCTIKNVNEVILSRTFEVPFRERIVGYLRHPLNYDK